MNRRLNPQLFEDNSPTEKVEAPTYSAVASEKLNKDISEMRKVISHLESVVEVLQSQVSQVSKISDKRTEAFSKALSDMEISMKGQSRELQEKNQAFEMQLNERRELDQKIENMVDRFNMSLQQFENRLATLQKVISDKEMAMMSYRNIIEQIVDEVEKLKANHGR